MLGQLNPGQTRLPLASLDFGDRDLTDGFTDVRDGTHSSISGFGHPRGSTPISVLSSRRSTTSTALSGESPESRRVLPNMSALLDFLDNDNTNPFPQSSTSNRKSAKSASHRSSRSSPQTRPASHPHPKQNSLTPRPRASDLDLPSHFLNTYERANPFRGALPTSSTPFTTHHDDFSEMSSPLNKRHNGPSGLQASIPPLQFSHPTTAAQTSPSPAPPNQASPNPPRQYSPPTDRPASHLPTETPAKVPTKAPSAADRLAAAVMEGAPESHWTFLMERGSSENAAGIRRSKVVEELLQPMRPSISCPGKQAIQIPENIKDSDLPQSLLDETRRTSHLPSQPPLQSTSEPIMGRSRLTRSAGHSSSPNLIRPTPLRPSVAPADVEGPSGTNPSSETEQTEVLDVRVNQLLSHIRSDQLEKANLVAALAEARSEVAALSEEVRLLRIGVQKLGEEKPPQQHVDFRLEPRQRPTVNANPNSHPGRFTNEADKSPGDPPHRIKELTQHLLGDLALGLTFTRCVDQLLMHPTSVRATHSDPLLSPPRPAFRPDSQIFDPDNLERMFCRLKVWKQLVLRKSSSSFSTHPSPPVDPDPSVLPA
ncbi:hypothetical protein PGT21_025682 [Puccinia graminis f. sp. tritici]|uniref:Uncharacterized protein n=1 Tax=Puccinia graminis f. sp. tritici TaxID=56615 RepID=A0A5B0MA22_PUCGR|nr:hypothetical protein PGT21_025682 [Puccinia graminis f. sp. tritici]KAA1072704.1 hypothetical protein PGTUg99_020212 [Puccinia graminis f. sp. tritici]